MKKLFTVLFLLMFSTLAFSAEKVVVFAAASVSDMMDEIIELYKSESGTEVVGSYAASGALAKQIEAGAPAGIFISADPAWTDQLEKQGLIEKGSRKDYLGNTLVLIAPKDSKLKYSFDGKEKLSSLLKKNEKLAIGDPDYVPAGKYAQEALTKLDQWAELEPSVARADNVRVVLSYVSKKAVAMGVVYGSDAAGSTDVKILADFPDGSYEAIRYPVAIVSKNANDEVRNFYDFLNTPKIQDIIKKHGFTAL